MDETLVRLGRMEQAADGLTAWINSCHPEQDRKLICILYTKLQNLMIKLNYVINKHKFDMKIEPKGGKDCINVMVDEQDFCSMYGKNWPERFERLRTAMELYDLAKKGSSPELTKMLEKIKS